MMHEGFLMVTLGMLMATLGIFMVLQGTLVVNQGTLVITTRVTRYLKVTKFVLVNILGMFDNFFLKKRKFWKNFETRWIFSKMV